jgi:hypothetical protein
VVEGVAHLLHLQRPEPVARGLAAFFARHPIDRQHEPQARRSPPSPAVALPAT